MNVSASKPIPRSSPPVHCRSCSDRLVQTSEKCNCLRYLFRFEFVTVSVIQIIPRNICIQTIPSTDSLTCCHCNRLVHIGSSRLFCRFELQRRPPRAVPCRVFAHLSHHFMYSLVSHDAFPPDVVLHISALHFTIVPQLHEQYLKDTIL